MIFAPSNTGLLLEAGKWMVGWLVGMSVRLSSRGLYYHEVSLHATLDQRFPYKESEERDDPLVARSEAFQMIGPIKLSHSTGGIWV